MSWVADALREGVSTQGLSPESAGRAVVAAPGESAAHTFGRCGSASFYQRPLADVGLCGQRVRWQFGVPAEDAAVRACPVRHAADQGIDESSRPPRICPASCSM
jgi:hypothetical protein